MTSTGLARLGPAALVALAAVTVTTAAAAEDRPRPWAIKTLAVPITVGLTHVFGVPQVNRGLHEAGYSEVGQIVPNLSIGITTIFGSRLVVEPQYRFIISSSDDATLILHHFLLNAGYLAYRRGEVLLYPFLGFGLGNATLDIAPPLQPQRFDRALYKPTGDLLLSSSAFVLHGGIAANLWGSGHGDFVGLRTGIVYAPGDRSWKRRGVDVLDGPEPPMGGAYFALALGFHGPGAPQTPAKLTGRR